MTPQKKPAPPQNVDPSEDDTIEEEHIQPDETPMGHALRRLIRHVAERQPSSVVEASRQAAFALGATTEQTERAEAHGVAQRTDLAGYASTSPAVGSATAQPATATRTPTGAGAPVPAPASAPARAPAHTPLRRPS